MKHTGSHTIIIDSFDNIFCEFIKLDHKIFECAKCGTRISIIDGQDGIPQIPCRNPLLGENIPISIHNFASRIQNLEKDLCSVDTIEQRHSVCKSCTYFAENSCTKCGCSIIRDRNYLNKIAIKSESCPIGLWKESDI